MTKRERIAAIKSISDLADAVNRCMEALKPFVDELDALDNADGHRVCSCPRCEDNRARMKYSPYREEP